MGPILPAVGFAFAAGRNPARRRAIEARVDPSAKVGKTPPFLGARHATPGLDHLRRIDADRARAGAPPGLAHDLSGPGSNI